VAKALEIALDTRKFEIGMYWQRTTFYWTLIAAAFTGYVAVLALDFKDASFYALVLACLGFSFSVAWFMVNLGSKYWQENWENHVDLLADKIAGPIFRTIMSRDKEATKDEKL